MKLIKLYIIVFFLIISSNHTTLFAQCASYSSSFPPPYPEEYQCMQNLFLTDPMCCDVEFDNMCKSALLSQCGTDFSDFSMENCYKDPLYGSPVGDCVSRPSPALMTNGCEVYVVDQLPEDYPSAQAPPSDILPTDPCVLEIQLFDPNCCCCQTCQPISSCNDMFWTGWDMCCRLLYSDAQSDIGVSNHFARNNSAYAVCGYGAVSNYKYVCDDNDPTTVDFCDSELGCFNVRLNDGTFLLNISLEGPVTAGTSSSNQVTLNQPFGDMPWNFSDAVSTTGAVLSAHNVLDWILVDFIDRLDGTTLRGQTVGLLLSNSIDVNGQTTNVISPDGLPGIKISANALDLTDSYLLKIRSFNHMDVFATQPVIALGHYDFTQSGQVVNQSEQMVMTAAGFSLLAGDLDGDGRISSADFNVFMVEVGNCPDNCPSDLDRDGDVDQDDFSLLQNNMSHIGISTIRYNQ